MDIDYRLSLNVLRALGGDTSKDFQSVEEIWDDINGIYDNAGDRLDIQALILDIKNNGLYEYYPSENADAYAPVRLNVNVPQKYTEEYIQELEKSVFQEGYNEGNDVGYRDGYTAGNTDGFTDGYAEGLDDGGEQQKALLSEVTVKENGVYEREDGYKKVHVEVDIPTFETETLSVELTENGTHTYTPTTDGFSSVEVSVNVDIPDVTPADLRDLIVEVKENKEYEFLPTDYDGWKKVNLTVSVPTGGGGDSGKPKIPNGFRLTEKDTADIYYTRLKNVDFSQYDWSDVYDMSYFFAGFRAELNDTDVWSVTDFSNFIENFNGRMLCMRNMFKSGTYKPLKVLPNFGELTKGCRDMSFLCESESKLTNAVNVGSWNTSSVITTQRMFYACSKLKYINLFDTSNVLNARDMFRGCSSLTSIPVFDTSNMRDVNGMFSGCGMTSIPNFDFGKVVDIGLLFQNCKSLKSIPDMNFRNVLNFTGNGSTSSSNSWIGNCTSLTSIGVIDCDNIVNFNYAFGGAANTNITQFGGFRNLGKRYNLTNTNSSYGFPYAPNLTYESLLNVIDGLYDRASVGYPVLTLKMHTNHMALLTDTDIAAAVAKGWSLSS